MEDKKRITCRGAPFKTWQMGMGWILRNTIYSFDPAEKPVCSEKPHTPNRLCSIVSKKRHQRGAKKPKPAHVTIRLQTPETLFSPTSPLEPSREFKIILNQHSANHISPGELKRCDIVSFYCGRLGRPPVEAIARRWSPLPDEKESTLTADRQHLRQVCKFRGPTEPLSPTTQVNKARRQPLTSSCLPSASLSHTLEFTTRTIPKTLYRVLIPPPTPPTPVSRLNPIPLSADKAATSGERT